MVDQIASRFRKKYALTLLLFLGGTFIAIDTGATLQSYTVFASALLAIFGTQDLVDKGKVRQFNGTHKPEE